MANLTGVAESFAPGSVEYSRVEFDISKDKYYKPSRTSLLFLTGMGDIPGAQATADQKKTSIALESRVTDQMEIEILTQDARITQETTLVTGSLPTGTKGTASTYTVADASILRPFDVIKNMTTNEYLLVLTVDTTTSPDQITALPGASQTGFSNLTAFPFSLTDATPAAKTNGDVIRIVGTAYAEGSTAGTIIDSRPTTSVNYISIFREEFGVTFEEAQTKKHGRMTIEDKNERAKGNLLVKLEKALVEGAINKETPTAGTTRQMQGIKGTISTNNQAASALVGGGNDITVPKLDQIGDQIAGANQSGLAIGAVSGAFIRKLRELMDNKVEVNVAVGSEDFGIKATRYESPFVTQDYVRHDIFDATGNSDEAMFIDKSHYELVNLRNGEMGLVSQKKGLPGAGTAANDSMTIQDAHYGAYTLDYRHEEGSALITGLSHTISS